MVVDSIGIYELKGPYYTLTMTNWFLQALSVIPRGSWGDVASFVYIKLFPSIYKYGMKGERKTHNKKLFSKFSPSPPLPPPAAVVAIRCDRPGEEELIGFRMNVQLMWNSVAEHWKKFKFDMLRFKDRMRTRLITLAMDLHDTKYELSGGLAAFSSHMAEIVACLKDGIAKKRESSQRRR
ncbi:hypothetical protein F511_17174 [Dorcoceras hygrometricum]|uniref:Uncharacterized protein n=1 Tax=Dorcoceras hygrometricum TaxID=472368 RepID=A0A2Z7CX79_9LAMI|nr:hypothetical protein F511_17174 [Dorcoceras hygrometricum]